MNWWQNPVLSRTCCIFFWSNFKSSMLWSQFFWKKDGKKSLLERMQCDYLTIVNKIKTIEQINWRKNLSTLKLQYLKQGKKTNSIVCWSLQQFISIFSVDYFCHFSSFLQYPVFLLLVISVFSNKHLLFWRVLFL